MRSLPQKVTGYRVRRKRRHVNRGPAISREVTARTPLVSLLLSLLHYACAFPLPAPPPPSPRLRFTLVSQLLFFDASSFLIAANRDVKTIRGPLARLGTRCSILFSLSQTLLLSPAVVRCSPRLCVSGEKRDAFWRIPFRAPRQVNNMSETGL